MDGSGTAVDRRIDGVVIGVLMGFAKDGAPLVVFPGNPVPEATAARTLAPLGPEDVGGEVALLFEGADPARPVVAGRLLRPEASRPEPERARVEQEKLHPEG